MRVTICTAALFAVGSAGRLLAQVAGTFDATDPVACSAAGWARDSAATDPVSVRIFRDGDATTGQPVVTVVADLPRSDLPFPDKNHGFSALFLRDSGLADGQAHQLYTYAIVPVGGQLVALNGNPKSLRCDRASRGALETIVDGGAVG